jgi:hypothetical protein
MTPFWPTLWPRWALMWAMAVALYAGCKWLTWQQTVNRNASSWKHAAYLLAWPGLDATRFLAEQPLSDCSLCCTTEWLAAVGKLTSGAVLLFAVARMIPARDVYLAGWFGMIGLVLILHFGAFHLLSCLWRSVGIEARPLMNRPLASASLTEFWGRRWNTAFRDLTHRYIFRPCASWFGARCGVVVGFLFSGALHDLVISVPARGGYGGPTAFFAIQGVAMVIERSAFGHRIGLGSGRSGRVFAVAVLVAPVGLLFPPSVRGGSHRAVHACLGGNSMNAPLAHLIFMAGIAQFAVLMASALVPFRLNWRQELQGLSRLHRQMYWGIRRLRRLVDRRICRPERPRYGRACTWERSGPRVLRVRRGVLGHPRRPPGRVRREAAFVDVVAQGRVHGVDGLVCRLDRRLRLGGTQRRRAPVTRF